MIGVVGGVREDMLGGQSFDQGMSLRDVVALAACKDEAYRQAQAADHQVNLAGQAAARAADRLILRPPFAPAACWCARTMVESTIAYSKSGSSDRATKMRRHTPPRLQRLNRTKTLFHSPNTDGRSR